MGLRDFWFNVVLRKRSSSMIVKKSDDEITRLIKQERITRTKKEFEKQFQLDVQKKEERGNTKEIRAQHYENMANLERNYYQKAYQNDNVMTFDYLHKRQNYKSLGQKWRPFFIKPMYAKRQDYEQYIGWQRHLFRAVMGLICIKAGYEFGKIDSADKDLANSKVLEFKTEEQIFDLLINKKKLAVFLYLWTPGPNVAAKFNDTFDRESSKYLIEYRRKEDPWYEGDEEDDIVFMRVLCRKHLNFCNNKMWPNRIQPYAELYSLNDEGKIEITDFKNWHRSPQGIVGFFKENGIIEDKHNPEELLERAGRKFIEIL